MTDPHVPRRPAVVPPSSTSTPTSAPGIGRAARTAVPRSSHAEWAPAPDRADPAALLAAQETTRVPELVPLRHERMLVSPFTFYRGAAVIMAADLAAVARTPGSGSRRAATRTSRTSAASPRPTGRSCSTSTTSTRPALARSSGTSSASPRASRSRPGRVSFTAKEDARVVAPGRRSRTARRWPTFARMTNLDVWYARLDVEKVFNEYRSRATPERDQALRAQPGQGPGQGQHEGVRQAHRAGRRRVPHQERSARRRPARAT